MGMGRAKETSVHTADIATRTTFPIKNINLLLVVFFVTIHELISGYTSLRVEMLMRPNHLASMRKTRFLK